jgi:hypothetical protein
MSTSGIKTLTTTRDKLIHGAFRLLRVKKAIEGRMQPLEIHFGSEALNMMLATWQSQNIGLWLNREAVLHLQYNQASYSIGPTGDNCTLSAVKTAIDGAVDSGESSITVDDDTGISDGDYIGIQLDSGYLQWTTVNGTPAANVIALDAALTDDVNDGAMVYAYTTKIPRPMDISLIRRVDQNGNEIPMSKVSRERYMNQPSKTTLGTAVIAYFDPQLTNGKLYVWQTPSTVTNRIFFTAKVSMDFFVNAVDEPEFPFEWFETIKYNLAVRLFPEHSVDMPKEARETYYREVQPRAEQLFATLKAHDLGDEITLCPGIQ